MLKKKKKRRAGQWLKEKKILVYGLNLSGRTDKKPVKVVALDHENRVAGREEDFSGSSFCVCVKFFKILHHVNVCYPKQKHFR